MNHEIPQRIAAVQAEAVGVDEWCYLGDLLRNVGRWDEARQCYEQGSRQALSVTSADALAVSTVAEQRLAGLYHQLQHFAEARQTWQGAIARTSSQSSSLATLYNNLGQTLAAISELDQSLAATWQAIQLDPNYVLAHRNLGGILQRLDQPQAAALSLERAIHLSQDVRVGDYNDLAVMLLQSGHPLVALRYFVVALQHVPWSSSLLAALQREEILTEEETDGSYLGAWERAVAQLVQVLGELQDQRITLPNLAEVFFGQDRTSVQSAATALERTGIQVMAQACQALAQECWAYGDSASGERWLEWRQLWLAAPPDLGSRSTGLQNREATVASSPEDMAVPAQPGFVAAWRSPSASRTKQAPRSPHWVQGVRWQTGAWLRSHPEQGHVLGSGSVGSEPRREPDCAPALQPSLAPHAATCQGVNCLPCWERLRAALAPQIWDVGVEYFDPNTAVPLPDGWQLFVAELRRGQAWAMPHENWRRTCEAVATLTEDRWLLADLSREYEGTLPGCPRWRERVAQHRLLDLQGSPVAPTPLRGRVATITALSPRVYFHWMMDALPRIDFWQQIDPSWSAIDHLWVNGLQPGFQQETLTALGIPIERCIDSNQVPYIQADRLVVPSFTSALGWASPRVVRSLRQRLLPWALDQPTRRSPWPKRLYLSRATARYRRLVNEADLEPMLERSGFTMVRPEQWSVAEQIQCFAQAEAVIAPHGAGLTNLVFAQPGTVAIELNSPGYRRYYYGAITRHVSLPFYSVMGEALELPFLQKLFYGSSMTEDFWIDPQRLKLLLQQMGFFD